MFIVGLNNGIILNQVRLDIELRHIYFYFCLILFDELFEILCLCFKLKSNKLYVMSF
jgi:hypothetical protein